MQPAKMQAAHRLYLYLGALFITSLVVSNLIFQKFFYWYPFDWEIMGYKLFELSVGILPYPITFLITDLISEIYGKKAANRVVVAGIFASFFSMGILLVAGLVPAMPSSPLDDATFTRVFALSPIAVLASMMAYLLAQFIDIRIYHFWKNLTQGRHLAPLAKIWNSHLVLAKIPMQSACIITIFNELFSNPLGVAFGAAKHNRIKIGLDVRKSLKGIVTFTTCNQIVLVVDVCRSCIFCANRYFDRVVHKRFCDSSYLFGHGRLKNF